MPGQGPRGCAFTETRGFSARRRQTRINSPLECVQGSEHSWNDLHERVVAGDQLAIAELIDRLGLVCFRRASSPYVNTINEEASP